MASARVKAILVLVGCASALRGNLRSESHLQNNAALNGSLKSPCWQKRPVWRQGHRPSFLEEELPGFGMDEAKIVPFETVSKDGFFHVDCLQDALMEYADKHGASKFRYADRHGTNQVNVINQNWNVSIIWYDRIVPKLDQKAMTPDVCFEFCRTVPDAVFFGLRAGRQCYCTPFFERYPGDDSDCAATCEGDHTRICGGMTKQDIYEMHRCADTKKNLLTALGKAAEVCHKLSVIDGRVASLSDLMLLKAESSQESLGTVGDPQASELMQDAKVCAGEMMDEVKKANKVIDRCSAQATLARSLNGMEPEDYEFQRQAEAVTKELKISIVEAELATEKLTKLDHVASPVDTSTSESRDQYYELLYFVDKSFMGKVTTCSGKQVGCPKVNTTFEECSSACDADLHNCRGFSYYPDQMCFLFSKFETLRVYTNSSDLHMRDADRQAVCMGKFSAYNGANLKPDPSGMCPDCLKEFDVRGFITSSLKDDTLKLTETPILMTHDSATGYFGADGLLTKVQETGFTGQLSCGARAFDLRLIWMNGEAHWHHMPTQDGALLPTTYTSTTLESTIGEFINFANGHEDELLILYISHCAIAQKCVLNQCATTEPLPCDNANFEKIYDDHKLFVANHEKGCEKGECLKNMSVRDAKQKAKDQGQKGIIVVLEAMVEENWDNNVKCGLTSSTCESEFDGPVNNYFTNYFKDKHNPEKLQILQAHWQGTAVEAKNRDFNQRVASDNGPVMKNKDKLNLLQINFICDGGADIAKKLGTNVDKCSC